MVPQQLTRKEWRAAIVAAYVAGERVSDICARFGCSGPYPSMLAKRAGLPPRPLGGLRQSHRKKMAEEAVKKQRLPPTRAAVHELDMRGFSPMQIAAVLRAPYREVTAILNG